MGFPGILGMVFPGILSTSTELLPKCWNSTPTFPEFRDPHPFSRLLSHSQLPSQSPAGIQAATEFHPSRICHIQPKNPGEIQKFPGEFQEFSSPEPPFPAFGMGNSRGSPLSHARVENEIREFLRLEIPPGTFPAFLTFPGRSFPEYSIPGSARGHSLFLGIRSRFPHGSRQGIVGNCW